MKDEEISVVSALPGRIRLKVRRVKNDPVFAARLESDLTAVPGVHSVEVNTHTAGVLVVYDHKSIVETAATKRLIETLHALFPKQDLGSLAQWIAEARMSDSP